MVSVETRGIGKQTTISSNIFLANACTSLHFQNKQSKEARQDKAKQSKQTYAQINKRTNEQQQQQQQQQ